MITEFAKLLPYIPASLVLLRLAIGPVLLGDALDGNVSGGFLVAFIAAFFSDIFDGILARRLKASTAQLRQADSWADVCLYLCVSASAVLVHPDAIAAFRLPLLSVVFVQLLWWGVNLLKYGQPASYHTYSAKLWGLTLFAATVALFGFNYSGVTLWLAVIVGIAHTLEEIVMTLILPVWTHDVLSLVHALRLRRSLAISME
jgi:phosphatidylglycerophosphate synthase